MGLLGFSWGARRNVESLFVSAIDSLTFWPPGASGRSWALPRPRRPHLRYPPRVGWNHVLSRVQATRGVSNMVVPSWNHVFSRVQATQGGYLTWWSRAGTTCFHVSRPNRGVSNMVVPSWNHVFSRIHDTQVDI